MTIHDDFNDDIDWDVHKTQQNMPPMASMPENTMNNYSDDVSIGPQGNKTAERKQSGYVPELPPGINMMSGMIGSYVGGEKGEIVKNLPQSIRGQSQPTTSEYLSQILGDFIPGLEFGGAAPKAINKVGEAVKKGAEYMDPGVAAEKFRSTLGEGTSSQNIQTIGKRVQLGKQSATDEALIPKKELYAQEGKSNVYDVNSSHLPEGNIPGMAEMIAPGEKYGENQARALSKAISEYRKPPKFDKNGKQINKGGDIEQFTEHAENIFGVPELSEKAAEKVESALLMPTKRSSAYFADKGVAEHYSSGLKTLHDAYEKKPILANYDALQSAIKKEMRKLSSKGKLLDTNGGEKLASLKNSARNLNADKEGFMKTLPEKMQNLENDFRTKWRTGPAVYENAGKTIRKLAEGKWQEVSPAQIGTAFTRMNKNTMKVLQDMGPSAGKNILYNALQKVNPGDAEGMAQTVLDLRRTKGYDQFVDQQMVDWANNTIKHVGRVGNIKKALLAVPASVGAGSMLGPVGAIGGLVAPFVAPQATGALKYLGKYLKK